MTQSERRPRWPAALVPAAAALGVLVLVWAATTGPTQIIGSSGRRLQRPSYAPAPTADASSGSGKSIQELLKDQPQTHDLHWIGDLIIWTVMLAFVAGLVYGALWLWRNRWHPPAKPAAEEFDILPDVRALSEAIARDGATQLAAIAEGSPRNGIVRCWLRLEEIIADAGLPREAWETSAEFTVRVLKTLDIDPRAIGTLARLYREARFSEHALDENARTTARSALRRLHGDLQELGVHIDPEVVQ